MSPWLLVAWVDGVLHKHSVVFGDSMSRPWAQNLHWSLNQDMPNGDQGLKSRGGKHVDDSPSHGHSLTLLHHAQTDAITDAIFIGHAVWAVSTCPTIEQAPDQGLTRWNCHELGRRCCMTGAPGTKKCQSYAPNRRSRDRTPTRRAVIVSYI